MPKLLSLEMQGFKSFANRTKIVFPDGLVVIIGPNGSGKSNISDAICFVLGKRSKKDMRTEKLSHLIFNGGKAGKGADFARVMLNLDNSKKEFPYEGKVFSLSRTVDKDGTSTYRINGKRCTLAEVQNALQGANIDPDGMNIIIQGEIAKFVDMSPVDKRIIIEDIAGISVYEAKKRKALSELESVEGRTKEGRIVLAEKKKYLDELKVEKDQAERYLKKKDELESSRANLLLKQIKEMKTRVEKIDVDLKSKSKSIEKWETKVEKDLSQINELRAEVERLTEQIEQSGEQEQIELGRDIQQIQDKLSELRGLVKNHSEEVRRINSRDSEISKNIGENQGSLRRLNSEKMKFEAGLDDLKSRIRGKKTLLEDRSRSKYLVLKERLIGLEKDLFVKEEKLKRYDSLKDNEIRIEELKDEKVGKEKKSSNLSDAIEELENRLSQHVKKLKEVEEYLSHLEKESIRISERSKSTKLEDAKRVSSSGISGIHGVLSELFEVRDNERAVLSFAGPLVEAVVVDNLKTGEKVSDFVKKNELGEVLVLPMDEIRISKWATSNGSPLIESISFDQRYRKLFEAVFSGFLVKSLSGTFDSVTPEGDSLRNGVMRCGGKYEDFEKLALRVEEDKKRYLMYRNNLKDDIDQIKDDAEKTKINAVEIRRDIKDISNELGSLQRSMKDSSPEKIGKLKTDISGIKKEIKVVEKEMENCDVVSEEFLQGLRNELEALEDESKAMEREVMSIESQVENVVSRDLKNFENIKKALESDVKRFEKEIEEAKKEIEEQELLLKEKQAEFQNIYSKLRNSFAKRDTLKGKIAELEKSKALTEQKIDGIRRNVQDMKIKRAELLGTLEGLNERFKEYGKGVDVRKTINELEGDIRSLEKELANFGPVNMKALETFRDIEKEYVRLEDKVKQLEEEIVEIYKMIEEIESKKNQSFMSCFRKINRKFGSVFEVLSPGGKAKFILENEENPLDGGIDFVVRPFGKKLSSLKQLSGGEKTLVTLAFLFAIQEYEVSPFYVFDEIDAALDKTNSEKLADLVNGYTKAAQFVIISHNDELVASADYLYGVSMKPSGISQVVSIKLKE
jgi:chromosome segregation protein